jgi:L-iditol 2-dehydrogenase
MDWIVRKGVVRIPRAVSYEQASFIEPVITCWKAVDSMRLEAGDTVLVIGQGPIGIMLAVLAKRAGARVITSDLFPQRLTIARSFGLTVNIDGSTADTVARIRELTEGRGADAVILAVGQDALIKTAMDCTRPGGKVMLFAQTQHGDATIDPAAICMDEKTLMGSYSASVDLQDEVARFVLSGELNLEALYSHRFPLSEAVAALRLAAHPQPATMKIAIQPGRTWQGITE